MQHSGAPDQLAKSKYTFFIREGLSSNYFFQWGDTSAHIIISDELRSRIYVNFPAGNSGIALTLDRSPQHASGLRLTFGGEPEKFSRSLNDRGVQFEVQANRPQLIFVGVIMDSIRYVRDSKIPEYVRNQMDLRREFLSLANLPEEGYLIPSASFTEFGNEKIISFTRRSFDNKKTYYCEIRIPEFVEAVYEGGRFTLTSKTGQNVKLMVAASMDFEPLTPYNSGELFNSRCVQFEEKLKCENPEMAKKLSNAQRALRFLSYGEKFLAGSWRFLTYFGRDTMVSLMLLKDSVTNMAYESAMQSVLDRISDNGAVAHEEDIGCFAISQHLPEYIRLKRENRDAEAEEVKKHLADPVYDYSMVDDDFLFSLMLTRYIKDDNVSNNEKRIFLEKINMRGEKNIETVMKNFNYILNKTDRYNRDGKLEDLIRITHEHVGDWRDSRQGLGWGVYPGSVNIFLVPNSLFALMLMANSGIFSRTELGEIAKKYHLDKLHNFIEFPKLLEKNVRLWRSVKDYFKVKLPVDEVRTKLKDYIENFIVNPAERDCIKNVKVDCGTSINDFVTGIKVPDALKDGLEFFALSLDREGRPIEVMNSDIGLMLFFGRPDADEIRNIMRIINLPYPLGLGEVGGILTANPIFASDKSLWRSLDRNAYHGSVVWSWQLALMEKGLIRQIKRYIKRPKYRKLVKEMYGTLKKLFKMEVASGELINSELWTHRCENGCVVPVAFGEDIANETESNPAQLWSTVCISTMQEFDEISEMIDALDKVEV